MLCEKQSDVPRTLDARLLPEVPCAQDAVGDPGGRPWHVGRLDHESGDGRVSRGLNPGMAGKKHPEFFL